MHLNVTDHAAWYAERHPNAKFGDLVPEVCGFCFGGIVVGDCVITRRFFSDGLTVEPHQRGEVIVVHVNPRDGGKLYVLKLESGDEIVIPRSAVRKRFEREG